jgi:hypothetical protein
MIVKFWHFFIHFFVYLDTINMEPVEAGEEEQEYDETEDDSYMGDAASDDVDGEPQSPPW